MCTLNFDNLLCIDADSSNELVKAINDHDNSWKHLAKNVFSTIPENRGIYIWGVRKDNFFCPWYVGLTKNIQQRIKEHLNPYGAYSIFDNRELFDLSANTSDFYKCIQEYNCYRLNNSGKKRIALDLHNFFNCKPDGNKSLIFFQNKDFWNFRYGLHLLADPNQRYSLSSAFLLNSLDKVKISNTRNYIANNFCVAYSVANEDCCPLDNLEAAVKHFLVANYNIHTTSKSDGYPNCDVAISLSFENNPCNLKLWDGKISHILPTQPS